MGRRSYPIFILWALVLTSCAPMSSNRSSSSESGTTGYFNPQGIPYVSQDDRMDGEIENTKPPEKPAEKPNPAKPVTPAAPEVKTLATRMKEFEISRFNANEASASRYGTSRFQIKIFFTDEKAADFQGKISASGSGFSINATSGSYTITGTLQDSMPLESTGKFLIKNGKESATILYRAYKARLTVHEDRDKKIAPGSEVDTQLKSLKENTFGWVNNWSVVGGRAFYLVDIIKLSNADSASLGVPVFAFKGESLRTGDQQHPADSLTPGFATDVKLVGNAEAANDSLRVYSAELKDKGSQEKYKFMLDVEKEKPAGSETDSSADQTGAADTSTDSPDTTKTPDIKAKPPTVKHPVASKPKPRPAAAPVIGISYLRVNTALPRTGRMATDFARNRSLPGVVKWISTYQSNSTLRNFYYYAYPLRSLIQSIGEAFDVAPTYAYLTVIESEYLTGGRYNNRQIGDHGAAFGPFQMHRDSATESGVKVTGDYNDERYYFAPAACGAARYMVALVDQFRDSDTTLAILGYNQGGTGAKNLARRYGYTYVEMSRSSSISLDIRKYVDRKLAIYFISSDMPKFGFNPKSFVNTKFPPMNTIMPSGEIHDNHCRAAVARIL